jgi:hypothetical protein
MEPAALPKHQVHPPTLLPNGVEFSVHTIPRAFRLDLQPVLPSIPLEGEPAFLLVPTCQRAAMDLVSWDDAVNREKDLLLERFVAWAAHVCDALAARGYWGDYVDPCSGLAVRTPHSRIAYPEVDAFETLLKWRTSLAGCCKVLAHPTWGTSVYLATLFARAPMDVLLEVLAEAAASVPVKQRLDAEAAGEGGGSGASGGGGSGACSAAGR